MAKNEAIRDKLGRILGYYVHTRDRITLVDPMKREIGYYDIKANQTWKSFPKELYSRSGNVLGLLLKGNEEK